MPKTSKPKIPKDHDGFVLAEDTALKRKRHSVLVAEAIHRSTLLDIQFGATLGFLFGIEASPAMAMYETIRNATAQIDTVRAAAKVVLGDDDAKLFSDIIKLATKAQKHRHRFAHWMWGYFPNDPAKRDTICFVEPEMGLYAWQAMASVESARTMFQDGPLHTPTLRAPVEICEYTLDDLRSAVERLKEVYGCLFYFQLYAHFKRSGDESAAAPTRQLLLAQPAIAELHKSQEGNRRNSSKPRSRPPPRSPKGSPSKPRRGRGQKSEP